MCAHYDVTHGMPVGLSPLGYSLFTAVSNLFIVVWKQAQALVAIRIVDMFKLLLWHVWRKKAIEPGDRAKTEEGILGNAHVFLSFFLLILLMMRKADRQAGQPAM